MAATTLYWLHPMEGPAGEGGLVTRPSAWLWLWGCSDSRALGLARGSHPNSAPGGCAWGLCRLGDPGPRRACARGSVLRPGRAESLHRVLPASCFVSDRWDSEARRVLGEGAGARPHPLP